MNHLKPLKTKKKYGATAEALLRASARRTLVDEYGSLAETVAPFKPQFARFTKLAETIRGWFKDEDAALGFVVNGDFYRATVGPRGNQTHIEDMQAVYDAVGHDRFIAGCTFSLAALALALGTLGVPASENAALRSAVNIASLTTLEPTGPRSLIVTELPE